MNENIIKQDSLLSNISNISVRIDHNHRDGSGFFKNYIRSNQNDVQIPIDALQDYSSQNHGCFMEKFMPKSREVQSLHQLDKVWVTGNNAAGLSEEEDDQSEQIQNQQVQVQHLQKSNQLQSQEIDEADEIKRQQLLMQKRLKNETKNIPKNYGKAIISFIEKYQDKVKQITKKNGVQYHDFIQELKEKKKAINTIADLRAMWIDYKYAKCMRLLSCLFLRKYALNYIFNSRICNYSSHIKYRYRLCEAIKEPFSFKHIKDY